MAKVNRDINIRSEEIQDLMIRKPAWIIRWGITTMFFIILLLLFFTWLMKYPDIIYGEVVITSTNPPVKLVSRAEGKIKNLYVADNQEVKAGQIIAEIENPISGDVISYLELYLAQLDSNLELRSNNLPLPDTGDRRYGDLQNRINEMRNDITQFNLKRKYDLEKLDITKLQDRIAYHKELISISEGLAKVGEEELKNGQYRLQADKKLYEDSVLSRYDYLQTEKEFHRIQQEYDQLKLNIVQYKLTLSAMEIELENKKYTREQSYQSDIERILAHREFVTNFINTWKLDFALTSPIAGRVSYLKPIYKNQYMNMGDIYFAIVQDNQDLIGWIDVPAGGYGKVELNQKVNVRLDNYPYNEYGMLEGRVVKLGELPDNNRYRIEVEFPNGLKTSYKFDLDYTPEMMGSAEIITKDRRLIERIFDSFVKLINREHQTSIES